MLLLGAGSHTVLALLEHGYSVTIIDNLDNSFLEAFKRMQELAGDKADKLKFIEVRSFRHSCVFSGFGEAYCSFSSHC